MEKKREIKLRVYDREKKVMTNGDCLWFSLYDSTIAQITEDCAYTENYSYKETGDRFVLLQFTGLLDKNGKEIYESDVVKRPDGSIGRVMWFSGGYWGVYSEESDWFYMFDCNEPEEHEVVGNIYENPELVSKV